MTKKWWDFNYTWRKLTWRITNTFIEVQCVCAMDNYAGSEMEKWWRYLTFIL